MYDHLTYDDFKARIDIQDVLKDAGYHFYRHDGLRYPSYVRLDNDGRRVKGDKFIVTANGKCCFQPPQQKVYNVISFITEHPEFFSEYQPGMNPHHLVNLVCNRLLNHPIEYDMRNIIKPQRDIKPFIIKNYSVTSYQKHNMENIKKFYPFFKSRMIDIPTQKAFAQNFVLASHKTADNRSRYYRNLSFPLHIPGKETVVGFEERGKPRLDGSSGYKGKALGSNSSEGLWIASPNGTALKDAKHVLWFESAYDAMAYYQLHAPHDPHLGDAVFLSTGGNPTVMQFRGVIREAQDACHHLCFDNDVAGKQFVVNFHSELRHLKAELPKVPDDMKEYMSTLTNKDDIFSGDKDYLPHGVYTAFAKYYDACDELHDMSHSRLCCKEDVEEQAVKVAHLRDEYHKAMASKLSLGSELPHLKDLGTYHIPEWALCAMENGDYEGLNDEEAEVLNGFIDKHFPDGYVMSVDWGDYHEFNAFPAFGTRNRNSLVEHGESPYLATKTYAVSFMHPTMRETEALANITVKREIPQDGSKDWNDQLIRQETEKLLQEEKEESRATQSGIDMDSNGEIEVSESDEKKHTYHRGR